MAFSADELRTLRRALAESLHPGRETPITAPERVEDVQDTLRLAEAIDEAVREGGRLRAFLLAELVRYRSALPGSAAGYLERLEDAVADGYVPDAADLAALRRLVVLPCGPEERGRRTALKSRCHALAEAAVRRRLAESAPPGPRTRARGLELLIGGAAVNPVPASTGGPIPMNASPNANEPVDEEHAAEERAEAQQQPAAQQPPAEPKPPAKKAAAKKQQAKPHIPTPAELFPHGVRRTG
jgi:hypothetical protein